jgi:hypothetical protein
MMSPGAARGVVSHLFRRERPAREAERFRCRLALDSLRRETQDDAKRAAERAAFNT